MYNPNAFEVTDIWNWIKKLNSVRSASTTMSLPSTTTPKVWVDRLEAGRDRRREPSVAVTYEPTGCGKVLFTTFQTANAAHPGLPAGARAAVPDHGDPDLQR